MKGLMWVGGLFLGAACLVGCQAAPIAQVKQSTTWKSKSQRLLVLPAKCSSTSVTCKENWSKGVSGIVMSEMEFGGNTLIRAEQLVHQARTRAQGKLEVQGRARQLLSLRGQVQKGAIYEDLPPTERIALFHEAQADAILSTQFQITARDFTWKTRTVSVIIRVGMGANNTFGKIARCTIAKVDHPGYRYTNIPAALEAATRCALRKWKQR